MPSAADLAAVGLTPKDFAKQTVVEIWPDNVRAVEIFIHDLGTQWRVGPCGPIGLDYGVLPFVFRNRGISRTQWNEVWEDIKVMEGAALKEMNSTDSNNFGDS